MSQRSSLFLLLIFCAYVDCAAQENIPIEPDTTQRWRVVTNDKNEFIGTIRKMENGVLTLETEKLGVLSIRMVDVNSMEEVDAAGDPESGFGPENFHSSRGMLLPNGFGLRRGEAYYQNVWVLFNHFSVGITRNFSIGVGTVPIYLFGASVAPLWIAPKVSIPLGEKLNLGAGILYVYSFAVNKSRGDGGSGNGIAYGVMTFGSRDRNASLGAGWGLSGHDFSRRPVVTFSTLNRLMQGSYLVSETYFIGEGDYDGDVTVLVSVAWRKRLKNVGLDFGGITPLIFGEGVLFFPIIGLSVPLSKNNR